MTLNAGPWLSYKSRYSLLNAKNGDDVSTPSNLLCTKINKRSCIDCCIDLLYVLVPLVNRFDGLHCRRLFLGLVSFSSQVTDCALSVVLSLFENGLTDCIWFL